MSQIAVRSPIVFVLAALAAALTRARPCAAAVPVLDGDIRALAIAGDRVAALRGDQVVVLRASGQVLGRLDREHGPAPEVGRKHRPNADEVLDLAGIPDDDLESDAAEDLLDDEGATANGARRRGPAADRGRRWDARWRCSGRRTAPARRERSPDLDRRRRRALRARRRRRCARAAAARGRGRSAAPTAVGARDRAWRRRPGSAGRRSSAALQRRWRVVVVARGARDAPARGRDLGRRTRRLRAGRRRRRDRRAPAAHADLRRPRLSLGPLRARSADPRRGRRLTRGDRTAASSCAARASPRAASPAPTTAPEVVLALGSDLLASFDGGRTWRARDDLPAAAIQCVAIASDRLWVGHRERSLRRAAGSGTGAGRGRPIANETGPRATLPLSPMPAGRCRRTCRAPAGGRDCCRA